MRLQCRQLHSALAVFAAPRMLDAMKSRFEARGIAVVLALCACAESTPARTDCASDCDRSLELADARSADGPIREAGSPDAAAPDAALPALRDAAAEPADASGATPDGPDAALPDAAPEPAAD